MNYFENLIQNYKQYNVRKSICVSKKVQNQLALEEPYVVMWENHEQTIMVSSFDEYIKSQMECSKVIHVINDREKLNDIYNALVYNMENYEELLNEINYIINTKHSLSLK